MGERISEREAARRLGMSKSSIHYQRQRGNFAYGPDGLLDWDEVQAKWQSQRPAMNPDSVRREQTAKVTSAVVKANFGKVRLAHLERSYLERAEAHEALKQEVDTLLARFATIPEGIHEQIAEEFDLSLADARDIVARVMTTALAEIGDAAVDAHDIVEKI
jgi:hypothetical protein